MRINGNYDSFLFLLKTQLYNDDVTGVRTSYIPKKLKSIVEHFFFKYQLNTNNCIVCYCSLL